MRVCPGTNKSGKKCSTFMSGVDRDPHSRCYRCWGQSCHRLLTCKECVHWSNEQWREYEKIRKRPKKPQSASGTVSPPISTARSTARTEPTPSATFGGMTADEYWRADRIARDFAAVTPSGVTMCQPVYPSACRPSTRVDERDVGGRRLSLHNVWRDNVSLHNVWSDNVHGWPRPPIAC